jgi:hypothetical protein
MSFKSDLQELKKLNLPASDFCIVGSGTLAIKGIRDTKDLDVIVTNKLWNDLLAKYESEVENGVERIKFNNNIEILNPSQSIFGNSGVVAIEEIFEKADVVDDIKFINLDHLKKIKLMLGREKDLNDIKLIDKYLNEVKYKMRVVRGAFIDPSILDKLGAKTIENLERDAWISIDEVPATLEEVKEMQKQMTKHYDDPNIPWYMDGYKENNKNDLIVAFGADDGENGRIFEFGRGDKDKIQEVVDYGISKGIPKEQMDFDQIDF